MCIYVYNLYEHCFNQIYYYRGEPSYTMADVQFSVSWEAYQKSICSGLSSLQQRGEFVDMTIAADGHHVKVHQMIMSLVSPYIKELITSAQCPHPVIFLNKISYQTLQYILEYAYTGEVLVARDRLGEFLEASKALHIKGLEKTTHYTETTAGDIHAQFDGEKNTTKYNIATLKNNVNEDVQMDDNHMDIHHIDDDDGGNRDHLQEVKTNPLNTLVKENAPPTQPSLLQYTVSSQGGLQLVLNRYLYSISYTRMNSERLWRCSFQRKKCPALVTTKADRVTERSGAHNHPYHDEQIMKRVRSGNMFSILSEAESASSEKKRKKTEDAD